MLKNCHLWNPLSNQYIHALFNIGVIGHVLQNVLVAVFQAPHNTEVGLCGSTDEHLSLLTSQFSHIVPILIYTTDLESLESSHSAVYCWSSDRDCESAGPT